MTDQRFEKVKAYVHEGLQGFERDPADSLYQKGFQGALVNISQYIRQLEKAVLVTPGEWR
jgi:hypothetical protein